MDHKKKSSKGGKRSAPQSEEDFLWECSICTYKNNPEAFKCMMCGVSKGTSTRKSRINPDHLAVQVQQALLPQQPQKQRGTHGESSSSSSQVHDEPGTSSGSQKKKNNYPKQRKPRTPKIKSQLENIDPSSAVVYDITVDDVAIQITEYKQKKSDVNISREGSSSRDARDPLNSSKNTSNGDKNPSEEDSE